MHDLKREADLEYFDRIELKFRVQAALDVRGVAKAVLLARIQKVANWFSLAPQRFNQCLGLIGWHDGVLFVMARIGQDLRERYQVPEQPPSKLLVLVRKLDDRDWLFPGISWQNDVDFLP